MKILFDTSVLVAGLLNSHSNHHIAIKWFQKIQKEITMFISAHSLAELFSVLTKLPLSPKISPVDALFLIQEIEKKSKVIALNAKDYSSLIKNVAESGNSGGIIFDAIIYYAALKGKVDKILTFNHKDFLRLCPENSSFILHP